MRFRLTFHSTLSHSLHHGKIPFANGPQIPQGQGGAWQPDPNIAYEAFPKEHYFFYGSLMDHSTLANVLKLRHPPELLPAKIFGYSCMLWVNTQLRWTVHLALMSTAWLMWFKHLPSRNFWRFMRRTTTRLSLD